MAYIRFSYFSVRILVFKFLREIILTYLCRSELENILYNISQVELEHNLWPECIPAIQK